jgi:hypothetical protein
MWDDMGVPRSNTELPEIWVGLCTLGVRSEDDDETMP